jgi:DNA-binding transcriptional regulator YhcF (GntR family)
MIAQAKNELANEQIDLFLQKMAGLGLTREEAIALIEKRVKER